MKKCFFAMFLLLFFSGCSEEPTTVELYMSNPDKLEAKLKSCGDNNMSQGCLNAYDAQKRLKPPEEAAPLPE